MIMLITVAITTVVWLSVTFLTRARVAADTGGLLSPDRPERRRLGTDRRPGAGGAAETGRDAPTCWTGFAAAF